MSVTNYISSITADRNTIRNKLMELGLAQSGDKLTKLAAAIDNIENQGSVNASVKEGESFEIKPGYHKGGIVTGTAGGGNYSLQTPEPVEPTKKQQTIAPTGDYYGLSSVIVKAIPNQYQDVSDVTATEDDVLANKIIVTSDGTVTAGKMPNNGAINVTLDTSTTSRNIDKGYHNGNGAVSIVLEEKTSIEPKKTSVTVTPTAGKVLSKVIVDPIPDKYQDVSNVDADAADVLAGKIIVDASGREIEGSMVNNGAKTATLAAGDSYTIPKGYHNGSGTITAETLANQTVANAVSGDILENKTAWVNGVEVTGGMANRGAVNESFDGMTKTSYTIPAGYHNGAGTVSLTNDIENALAAI